MRTNPPLPPDDGSGSELDAFERALFEEPAASSRDAAGGDDLDAQLFESSDVMAMHPDPDRSAADLDVELFEFPALLSDDDATRPDSGGEPAIFDAPDTALVRRPVWSADRDDLDLELFGAVRGEAHALLDGRGDPDARAIVPFGRASRDAPIVARGIARRGGAAGLRRWWVRSSPPVRPSRSPRSVRTKVRRRPEASPSRGRW